MTCTVAPVAVTATVLIVMPFAESLNVWPLPSGASRKVEVAGFVSIRYERLMTL